MAAEIARITYDEFLPALLGEGALAPWGGYDPSADPRILALDRRMPWEEPVFAHTLPVLYAVYPVPNGNWMVDAMPPEPGSFAQRLPLPEAWAGLRDAELAVASGVPDAVFAHARRFVGAARSREGALAMARGAIEIGSGPTVR